MQRGLFLDDMGLTRTCSAVRLTVREISRCIINSRKNYDDARIGSFSSRRRAKVENYHVLQSSTSRLHLPLDKVHVPLSAKSAAFCLLVADGGGAFWAE